MHRRTKMKKLNEINNRTAVECEESLENSGFICSHNYFTHSRKRNEVSRKMKEKKMNRLNETGPNNARRKLE